MSFILTWVVAAIAAAAACWLVPGLVVLGGYMGIITFALAVALVNASIRPIMHFISLPITILTLGIFHFVVNAIALNIASWLSLNLFHVGVYVESFWAALWGSIVISIVSAIVGSIVGLDDD
ncbi:MAG: phage holin family protein [Coriobacteriales bacterium]|nr:phage holin family protein [Coriobacteriales bacterium]